MVSLWVKWPTFFLLSQVFQQFFISISVCLQPQLLPTYACPSFLPFSFPFFPPSPPSFLELPLVALSSLHHFHSLNISSASKLLYLCSLELKEFAFLRLRASMCCGHNLNPGVLGPRVYYLSTHHETMHLHFNSKQYCLYLSRSIHILLLLWILISLSSQPPCIIIFSW